MMMMMMMVTGYVQVTILPGEVDPAASSRRRSTGRRAAGFAEPRSAVDGEELTRCWRLQQLLMLLLLLLLLSVGDLSVCRRRRSRSSPAQTPVVDRGGSTGRSGSHGHSRQAEGDGVTVTVLVPVAGSKSIEVEERSREMAFSRDLRACQTTPGACDVVSMSGSGSNVDASRCAPGRSPSRRRLNWRR